ncbi:hypothetical protein BV20DRAFT_126812 [Pilatotrama ljubarskyi]|nr:hypothetical protein BV20DRAFT_126812 [Pilatotrama ljubarskyi]
MFLLAALVLPLVLAISSASGAADPKEASPKIRPLKNLKDHCKFTVGGQLFDLCPVLEGNDGGWSVESERRTPPTITKTSYKISLLGPLEKEKNVPEHEQVSGCGPDLCTTLGRGISRRAQVRHPSLSECCIPALTVRVFGAQSQRARMSGLLDCSPMQRLSIDERVFSVSHWDLDMPDRNRRPLHPDEEPRVLQTVPVAGAMNLPNITRYHPGVNFTAQLAPAYGQEDAKHDVLHIRLHGGYYVYGPQKADLRFICDHGADEPTSPTHAWSWNGTHAFNWRTKQACGKQLSKPTGTGKATPTATGGPSPTDAPVEDDAPPPDSETPDESKELADEYPLSGRSPRATLALLLSSFTAVLALAYIAWFPPTRVRQYVSRFMKAHPRLARFRVGERVLMRWAYEDLEMDDEYGYGEGEEDVMVNFAPVADQEGIPLKPSPRPSGFTTYGAA